MEQSNNPLPEVREWFGKQKVKPAPWMEGVETQQAEDKPEDLVIEQQPDDN